MGQGSTQGLSKSPCLEQPLSLGLQNGNQLREMKGLVPSRADGVWVPESLGRRKMHGGSGMGALREQLLVLSVSNKETFVATIKDVYISWCQC